MREVILAVVALGALIASDLKAAEPKSEFGPADSAAFEPAKMTAIQKRKFELDHEFLFATGILPVDPFNKSLFGAFGYTIHFNENWAWEVAQLGYAYNLETSLMRKLRRTADAAGSERPDLPVLQWMASSHLVLKPLYGKQAAFNTHVIHLEAFLQAGPVVIGMENRDGIGLGVDVGGGVRLWLSRAWSLRFDLGEMVYLYDENGRGRIREALSLRLGMAATLGGGE